MKKGVSVFQIIVFILCGIGIVLAVLLFSDKLPIGKTASQSLSGNVVMWGTLPSGAVKSAMLPMSETYPDVRIDYVQKDSATMRSELVNALASGTGPDLITLTPADVLVDRDLTLPIPYTALPKSTYLATFIDESTNFLTDAGVVAFPMVVDPVVMYYNRDILTSSFTLNPPQTWDDVVRLNAVATKKTDAGTINVATAALGTFDNIKHAKELLTTLFFQSGNKLIAYDTNQKKFISTFADMAADGSGIGRALGFYTSFANPSDAEHYSWSAGLSNDRDQFIAGKLALYFGYASELQDIRLRNPNLNFDIAMMPQRSTSATKITYGTMTGVAVLKMSKNQSLAVTVAQELVKAPAITAYLLNDPTVSSARRDMLGAANDDARVTLINRSAIISQSWLDPNPAQTTSLLRKIVTDINAGATTIDTALTTGNSLLNSILAKILPPAASAQ